MLNNNYERLHPYLIQSLFVPPFPEFSLLLELLVSIKIKDPSPVLLYFKLLSPRVFAYLIATLNKLLNIIDIDEY